MFVRQKNCTGHKAAIYALAKSLTPNHFLSAGGDGWIVEWNIADPDLGRLTANVESQVFSMTTAPEEWPEQLVLAGNMTGGLHWINLNVPSQTKNIQHHTKGIYDLLWLKNEVFSAGGDGVLTRWNPKSKSAIESYHLSNKALRSIVYSPEKDLLAVGSSDGNIYLLQRADLKLVNTVVAHTSSVFSLLWLNSGQQLVSGGRDAMLKIWSEDFNADFAQPAHLYTINKIVQSPDLKYFATASRDRTIKIWSASSFSLLKVLNTIRDGCHTNSVNHLLWLDNNLISCSDDRSVLIWSPEQNPV